MLLSPRLKQQPMDLALHHRRVARQFRRRIIFGPATLSLRSIQIWMTTSDDQA
jgi:hypothetical protein